MPVRVCPFQFGAFDLSNDPSICSCLTRGLDSPPRNRRCLGLLASDWPRGRSDPLWSHPGPPPLLSPPLPAWLPPLPLPTPSALPLPAGVAGSPFLAYLASPGAMLHSGGDACLPHPYPSSLPDPQPLQSTDSQPLIQLFTGSSSNKYHLSAHRCQTASGCWGYICEQNSERSLPGGVPLQRGRTHKNTK